jgi:transposase-like protein
MVRVTLPKKYVQELNEHEYVENATEWSVTFTEEFKRKAYEEYVRGKSMREIFTEAGFDVKKLGEKRLQNFRNALVDKAGKEAGFADKRKDKSLQAPPSTEAQMMKRIRELEHRIAYLEQENEFLKKIQSLEEKCGGKAAKRKC